jgi:transaldolase
MVPARILLLFTLFLLPYLAASFSPALKRESRLFLDTADIKEWEELLPTGIFHGVTTNPTLLERAGQPCTIANLHVLAQKALHLSDEFMCQAWGSSAEELYQCGMALSLPRRDCIVVKVPVTLEGTKAASLLIQSGVRVCLTACYHPKQAMIASSIGAEYIAPYLGRMTDAGQNGSDACLQMQAITRGMQSPTRILVASIREAQTMVDLAANGMETFTFSPAVARELFVEPLTDEAAAVFEAAAAASKSSS